MTRRNAILIRKEILLLLEKNKEISIRQIETKVNTGFETIKRQVEDLSK
jgi:DNA-binding Lrp family transcriptional regulator